MKTHKISWKSGCHFTKCSGQDLYVLSGVPLQSAYPGYVHNSYKYPWTIHCSDVALKVQSIKCTGKQTELGKPCGPCAQLLKHDVIQGIEYCNRRGVSESSPFQWLTMLMPSHFFIGRMLKLTSLSCQV
jgi:hypothetical protein